MQFIKKTTFFILLQKIKHSFLSNFVDKNVIVNLSIFKKIVHFFTQLYANSALL